MPDSNKLELQVKAAEARIKGLETAIESLRKAAQPDSTKGLEKRLALLEAAVATKQDKKTDEQQRAADEAKYQKHLAQQMEEQRKFNDKLAKQANAAVDKAHLDTRLHFFEQRIAILEAHMKVALAKH